MSGNGLETIRGTAVQSSTPRRFGRNSTKLNCDVIYFPQLAKEWRISVRKCVRPEMPIRDARAVNLRRRAYCCNTEMISVCSSSRNTAMSITGVALPSFGRLYRRYRFWDQLHDQAIYADEQPESHGAAVAAFWPVCGPRRLSTGGAQRRGFHDRSAPSGPCGHLHRSTLR